MFHIRDEGQLIRWGFNFYPLRSGQFGFLFIGFGRCWWCRYAKRSGRFFFSSERDPICKLRALRIMNPEIR
jgi:hypothetical protein